MKNAVINKKRIVYTDTGKGFPIVLLHGYLETKEVWSNFAEKLSETFRVLCIDLPGHGSSENLAEIHDMETMAKHISLLLEKLAIKQCVMLGHSMGGYVALAFANNYTHKLSGLVLFHSSVYADNDEKKENRLREIKLIEQGKKDILFAANLPKMFANDKVKTHSHEIANIQELAKTHNEQGICSILRGMMARKDQQEFIKHINKPMLFIFGEKDNYIPVDAGKKMLNLNSEIQGVWLKNSGHMGFIEEEDLALMSISNFVLKIL